MTDPFDLSPDPLDPDAVVRILDAEDDAAGDIWLGLAFGALLSIPLWLLITVRWWLP